MNGVPPSSSQILRKRTVYMVSAAVGTGSTIVALSIATFLHPDIGKFFEIIFIPLVVVWIVALVTGLARLRFVGFLSAKNILSIPAKFHSLFRLFLLVRFGLLGALLILFVSIAVAALVGGGMRYCVNALLYVTTVRMFLDLTLGVILNASLIARRIVKIDR